MTDDKQNGNSNNKERDGEGGLGNLPPLSDFDSSGGFASDSGLPPLSAFDSDSGKEPSKESVGGLPPLGDISIETPNPTGGNIKPTPPGFEVADFGTPTFDNTPTFDTPGTQKPKPRNGFQDMAADSDFSPETPEIGPGPETDIDTPMFDSAFGGAGAKTFTPTFDTPAPTQAMETPMFGETPKDSPFDEGAFQPGTPFDAGTPMPDFSGDSTMATRKPTAAPVPPPPTKQKPAKAAKAGGGKSTMTVVLAALIFLAIGIFAGPFLSTKVQYIPNPLRTDIADRDMKIQSLENTIRTAQNQKDQGLNPPTVDEINKLLAEQERLATSIKDLTAQETKAKEELDKSAGQLDQVRADLENKNEEFVKAQEAFEDLQNQTAIVQARQMGLVAEVDRLTGLVGTLEEANARSVEVKSAVTHSIERLATDIKEGMPLTPEKFARANRIAAVDALKQKVSESNWITPDLFNEYTDLYLKEMEIGASTAYFFAKVPLTSGLGDVQQKWAECLMKGNWAVYYRSLDGKNIGSYENLADPGAPPEYGFREMLPDKVQKEIEAEVLASRGPDFDEKVKVIAEKQQISDGGATPIQRVFNSL